MFLSAIYLTACAVCTWQLIPMLLVAWGLGWLFWNLFKGADYKQEILELKNQLTGLKTMEASLKNEIGNINFEKEKIYSDYLDKRDAFNTLEVNFNSLLEEKLELENALDTESAPQVPQAEYDLLHERYTKLEGEMKEEKRTLIGVSQQDYDALQKKLALAQKEIEVLKSQDREIIEKIVYTEKNKPGQAPIAHVAPPIELENEYPETPELLKGSPRHNGFHEPPAFDEEILLEEATWEDPNISTDIITDQPGAPEAIPFAEIFQPDNFQVIEGIGPSIEALLLKDGINNWVELAACVHERLNKILVEAGPRYKIHDPTSWPKQADFAANNNWEGLVKYQRFLTSEKDTEKSTQEGLAKIEKLAARLLETQNRTDDLKVIEGISPKLEQTLKAAGIQSWKQLAETEHAALLEILTKAGTNLSEINLSNLKHQASLAASGAWEKLKKFQENNIIS